jgi:excisionase family DNA binding protein
MLSQQEAFTGVQLLADRGVKMRGCAAWCGKRAVHRKQPNSYVERMDQHNAPAISLTECQRSIPLTVRVKEACRLTGIGRSKLYELIAADEIDTIKVGTITLIPMASLKHFLDRRGLG